jgi:hypothetical protein
MQSLPHSIEIIKLPQKGYFCKAKISMGMMPPNFHRFITVLDSRYTYTADVILLWQLINESLEKHGYHLRHFSFGDPIEQFPEIVHAPTITECFQNISKAFWATAKKDISIIFFTNGDFISHDFAKIYINMRMIFKLFHSSEVHVLGVNALTANLHNLQLLQHLGYVNGVLLILDDKLKDILIDYWKISQWLSTRLLHRHIPIALTDEKNNWSKRIILTSKLTHMVARFSITAQMAKTVPWVMHFDRRYVKNPKYRLTNIRQTDAEISNICNDPMTKYETEINLSAYILELIDINTKACASIISQLKNNKLISSTDTIRKILSIEYDHPIENPNELTACIDLRLYKELQIFKLKSKRRICKSIIAEHSQCRELITRFNFADLSVKYKKYPCAIDALKLGTCVGIPITIKTNKHIQIDSASHILQKLNIASISSFNTPNTLIYPIYLFPEHWMIASKYLLYVLLQLGDANMIWELPYLLLNLFVEKYIHDLIESHKFIIRMLFETCQQITKGNKQLCTTFIQQKFKLSSYHLRAGIDNNLTKFLIQLLSIPGQNYDSLAGPRPIAYLTEEVQRRAIQSNNNAPIDDFCNIPKQVLVPAFAILANRSLDQPLYDNDPLWDSLLLKKLPMTESDDNKNYHTWAKIMINIETIFHTIGQSVGIPELIACAGSKLTRFQILAITIQNSRRIKNPTEFLLYLDFIASTPNAAYDYLLVVLNTHIKQKLLSYWNLRHI